MNWARAKSLIKRIPILAALGRSAERAIGRWGARRFNSSEYWDMRYRQDGSSGAGSYNRLARFKAEVLNDFVERHDVRTVIEFGSGDGGQLRLADYPDYTGVDVSRTAIERTRALFEGDRSKTFVLLDDFAPSQTADLTMSLDVIYHLVEDAVFNDHMEKLFAASSKYVAIYASNFDRRDAAHVRHRKFTDWIASHAPDFALIQTIPNRYPWDPRNSDETSFADFYFYERGNSSSLDNG